MPKFIADTRYVSRSLSKILRQPCAYAQWLFNILYVGIVMSHYTHNNLSPVTQVTVQQLWRTIAFMAGSCYENITNCVHSISPRFHLSLTETLVFAYLGLAIFSFHHNAEPSLIIWSIVSCLKQVSR